MTPTALKALFTDYQAATATFSESRVKAALSLIAPDAEMKMCHPFGTHKGADFYDTCLAPLYAAMPDLERRDMIVLAGTTPDGQDWVGCMGNYMGTFTAPFLGIPPTGHLAHMRYHEFFEITDGRVTQMQAIWDIPELMMQAGAWPLAPSLGREMFVPGPATQDGFVPGPWDREQAQASCAHVVDMLAHLTRHPAQGGPEVMELERFWHPRFNWYGPAGIGTARGVFGFRNWHQIPFLNAMPDRVGDPAGGHFFAEGDYVGFTAWPGMSMTLSGSGWLGIAPTGQKITMRSLDFWRLESGLIRENWGLVDLLDVFAQLGVDVLARMKEMPGWSNGSA